jgi:cytochrome b561
MNILNTKNNFGIVSILIHWIMAIIIVGLFVIGKTMIDLDYYDANYHVYPWWHKSFGLLIVFLLIFRLIWKSINFKVVALIHHKKIEIYLAKIVQLLLYILLFICCVSGYLISTADDVGVGFFDIFQVPSIISKGEQQSELAQVIHYYSTYGLIILASLHMIGALKHHFIDKDITLIRILKTREKK